MNQGQRQSGDTNALDVNLTDTQLLMLLKKPLQDAEKYWGGEFGLEKARAKNMKLWLPKHWEGRDYYDYQEESLYEDPRIFTSTETITATVNSRIPQLQVMPGNEGPIALQMAKDMQRCGERYVEKYECIDLFRLSTRNLQIKRGAFIKLRWSPKKGEHGEIISEFVQPEDIIVDQDAIMGAVPRFIAQKIKNYTVEELIAMFPDGEQAILKAAGVNRINKTGDLVAQKSQLGRKLPIIEIWFRFFQDGETRSGVAWIDDTYSNVIEKDRNPNWNYDDEEDVLDNFLDEPEPPFIPINYLNDGSSYFDQTTLIEQAASLQGILNKRGFQIMENADQAGGGMVFNTNMISKEDMGKLVGSPDERIGVKGDVGKALTRISPPPLPNYVIEDKIDARNEIDNIFGTHDVTRGEKSKNPTLGQDQMQLQGDLTRMDELGRAVERQARHFYRYLFQMMKVYYTEEHYFVANGEGGEYDFVMMKRDLIADGADVRVGEGSMLPPNKNGQQKWVADLVTAGLIDPLSVYEVAAGGNLPSPKKLLERYMTFKTDPMTYYGVSKDDDASREALLDIQVLNGGKVPKVRNEYTDGYLKSMNTYMIGGEFRGLDEKTKQTYMVYLQDVTGVMQQQMELMMTQLPTQDEVTAQNQKTAEQATLESALAGQGGGDPAAGGQPGQPGQTAAASNNGTGGSTAQLAQKMLQQKQPMPA